MKRILLILSFFSFISSTLFAQTNTWIGPSSTSWGTAANWSLNLVPTNLHDVVIPTGSIVNQNVAANTKSIDVQGTAVLNIGSDLNFTNASTIQPNATVNWSLGGLGGGGTLTNKGIVNLTSANNKVINTSVILNNEGTINNNDSGDLFITNGTLNNQATGIIDLKVDAGNISYSGGTTHILNNNGLIKKSNGIGTAVIFAELNNSSIGTIEVQSGTIEFNNDLTTLSGGTYHVLPTAVLRWSSTVTILGTLSGVLSGKIDWAGTVSIAAASIATFNFTGDSFVDWTSGSLNGGGTLINNSRIDLTTANNKIISGGITTLNNFDTINITDSGDLFITDGTVNNQTTGIIDLKSDDGNISYSGGTTHILNNNGLIKKSNGIGAAVIFAELYNSSTGTIEVQSGIIEFNNALTTLSSGTFNVSFGAVLRWSSTVTILGTLSGVLSGKIDWAGTVSIAAASTTTFNFTGDSFVDWTSGSLIGNGTLNNNSRIDLTTANNKIISGGTTTLNNSGKININDDGDLFITDGTVNNQTTGIIDLKSDAGNISYSGGTTYVLNNNGLIKKSNGIGTTVIFAELNNNSTGTIEVQIGTIEFNNALTTLSGGTYNVSPGAVLRWSSTVTILGTLSGLLSGKINWEGTVSIATASAATFNFTGDSFVDWSNGNLVGGGTLNNNSRIDLTTTSNKVISGGTTTLNNSGTINITDAGDLFITDGTVNNQATGIIDLKSDDGYITFSGGTLHVLNNNGLIKKSDGTGTTIIFAELNNNSPGTIEVQIGLLEFNNVLTTLSNGTYNVLPSAVLRWSSTVTVLGTLSGLLSGKINWEGTVSVAAASPATFNFTGNSFVDWSNGNLVGGGTLNNNSRIDLTTTSNKVISGATTLNNSSIINIADSGDLFITDGTVNNQTTGIIDLKVDAGNISYSGGTLHVLNNSGTVQKTAGTGVTQIFALTNNSGTIKASTGTLEFAGALGFNNDATGVVKGIATIDLPLTANFTNNGTFAPGASPGILTVIGDFKSTSSSVLEVELNGSTQGTQYDLLAIQGNAIMNGIVNVTLGFSPLINDTFIVATTTGLITQCGLAPTTTAVFGGFSFQFNVECLNNNQVVLRVTQKTLGIATNEFNENSIVLFPNPTADFVSIKNLSTENLTTATILDLSGRVLKSVNLKDIQNPVISFEDYASGYYLLKIEGENNHKILKKICRK